MRESYEESKELQTSFIKAVYKKKDLDWKRQDAQI